MNSSTKSTLNSLKAESILEDSALLEQVKSLAASLSYKSEAGVQSFDDYFLHLQTQTEKLKTLELYKVVPPGQSETYKIELGNALESIEDQIERLLGLAIRFRGKLQNAQAAIADLEASFSAWYTLAATAFLKEEKLAIPAGTVKLLATSEFNELMGRANLDVDVVLEAVVALEKQLVAKKKRAREKYETGKDQANAAWARNLPALPAGGNPERFQRSEYPTPNPLMYQDADEAEEDEEDEEDEAYLSEDSEAVEPELTAEEVAEPETPAFEVTAVEVSLDENSDDVVSGVSDKEDVSLPQTIIGDASPHNATQGFNPLPPGEPKIAGPIAPSVFLGDYSLGTVTDVTEDGRVIFELAEQSTPSELLTSEPEEVSESEEAEEFSEPEAFGDPEAFEPHDEEGTPYTDDPVEEVEVVLEAAPPRRTLDEERTLVAKTGRGFVKTGPAVEAMPIILADADELDNFTEPEPVVEEAPVPTPAPVASKRKPLTFDIGDEVF